MFVISGFSFSHNPGENTAFINAFKKSISFKLLTSANSQLVLNFLSIDEKADGLKPLNVVVC